MEESLPIWTGTPGYQRLFQRYYAPYQLVGTAYRIGTETGYMAVAADTGETAFFPTMEEAKAWVEVTARLIGSIV